MIKMARNPNADRNTSPDAKRRMANRCAMRLRRMGIIDRSMTDDQIETARDMIHGETDCGLPLAIQAVSFAMLSGHVQSDAPTLPEGWEDITAQVSSAGSAMRDFGSAAENINWHLRSLVWPTGSGLPAAQPKAKAAPVQPQSFERPKRRIVLE